MLQRVYRCGGEGIRVWLNKAEISGTSTLVKESENTADYTIKVNNAEGANVFAVKVNYDSSKLEFKGMQSLLPDTVFSASDDKDGTLTVYVGTSGSVTTPTTDLVKLSFASKGEYKATPASVTLARVDAAFPRGETADEYSAQITSPTASTILHSYKKASDTNGDGKVSLADLSNALTFYQKPSISCDVNLDGIVDTADFIIIYSFIGK